jgi:SAM-dependent methyltransferase
MMLAALDGEAGVAEIVEREDGLINANVTGPQMYFAPFRRWPPHHRAAMRLARGRVLDVGAGAGRVSLHLQERGHEVVAIDNSPGAVAVCRRRGVRDARLLDFADVDESLGVFDTIVLLGNNFGVFGSSAKAKRLLRRLRALTSENGRILAESRDVSRVRGSDAPWHAEYRRRNVERGRLPGQIRMRIRFSQDRRAVVRLSDGVACRDAPDPGRHRLAPGPDDRHRRHVRRGDREDHLSHVCAGRLVAATRTNVSRSRDRTQQTRSQTQNAARPERTLSGGSHRQSGVTTP